MSYTTKELKDSVYRVNNFIIKNKKQPKTVKVSDDTLTIKEYLSLPTIEDALIRINKWIKNYNQYPLYVNLHEYKIEKSVYLILFNVKINKPVTSKSKVNKSSKHGWLSPGQNTPYYCGPCSLRQVIYNLTGVKISQSTLAAVCGTTTSGTSHEGLKTGLAWFNKKYNYNLKMVWKNFSDYGSWSKIKSQLDKDNQAIFFHIGYFNGGNCAGNGPFGHYESARSINSSSTDITVNNSLGSKSGNGYVGSVQTRIVSCQRKMMQQITQPSICIISK